MSSKLNLVVGTKRVPRHAHRESFADVPVRAEERLEPALARADEAHALGISEGDPVMLVARTAFAANGKPVEISRDVFRGDRTRIVWESEIA